MNCEFQENTGRVGAGQDGSRNYFRHNKGIWNLCLTVEQVAPSWPFLGQTQTTGVVHPQRDGKPPNAAGL